MPPKKSKTAESPVVRATRSNSKLTPKSTEKRKLTVADFESKKLAKLDDFAPGDEVMTVFGQGYVESKRLHDLVVKLRNWALAQGQSPSCYLNPSACVKIPGFKTGDIAKTIWGPVRVNGVRRDGIHICESTQWVMADGKPPKLYLSPHAFALTV
jgi:hypothetical protein